MCLLLDQKAARPAHTVETLYSTVCMWLMHDVFAGHEVAMMMATMMMTTGMGTMTTGRALPAASGAR